MVQRLGRVSVISRDSRGTRTAALSTSSTASSGPRLRTRYHAPRRSTLAMSWRRRAQRWLGVSGVDTLLTRGAAATRPPLPRCRSTTLCAKARCPVPRRWRRHRLAAAESLERERSRARSEEHTSELQSPCNLVCRLLLEKKKPLKLTGAIDNSETKEQM